MQPSISSVGKTIRMNRIFAEDGRAVMVAINHGMHMGASKGLTDMKTLLTDLTAEHPDSYTIHKGIAMRYGDIFAGKSALVVKSTNATRFFRPAETPLTSVEEVVALGADAIAIGLSLADDDERAAMRHVGEVVAAAEKYGMPTVTHSYPCGNLLTDAERFSVENVSYAVRVSQELGVDIIKTFWTGSGSTFEKVVKIGSPNKVVISGGPRCETLRECFKMTREGIDAGAAGITYGRNIWEHEYPAAVLRGLVAIVHDGATIDQAMRIAEDCAGTHLA